MNSAAFTVPMAADMALLSQALREKDYVFARLMLTRIVENAEGLDVWISNPKQTLD